MKVSHARDGGQAVELEHAALVLTARELIHTYPSPSMACGEDQPCTCVAVTNDWVRRALPVLVSIADADREATGIATVLSDRALEGRPCDPMTETSPR